MKVALLHTADVHVATFDQIFLDLGQDIEITHQVAAHLLEGARTEGLDTVRAETLARLTELSQADAVICTCSTLGPLVADAPDNVVRIDDPVMEAACANGPGILLALCLESTRAASLDLLVSTAQRMSVHITPEVAMCAQAWPHFEAGEMDAFAQTIAEQLRKRVAMGGVNCIVLGQASMRVVEPLLTGLHVPVLSSPGLAARAAIKVARA